MESKEIILDDRYKILQKLGEGAFGAVYKGKDILTKDRVAIKLETIKNHSQIPNEVMAYNALLNIKGIPKLHSSGYYNTQAYIIIDLLGKTLHDYFLLNNARLSLNCVCNIGIQILKRLEDIHDHSYIHRDIKPANIVVGRRGNKNLLYLIDFGLSKKYRDPFTKQHTLYGERRQVIGNLKYSSFNTHQGVEQSRRDDVEACFYVVLNMYIGSLPWEKVTEVQNSSILNVMKKLTIEQICEDCPVEFVAILRYVRSIHFEERPNYEFIKEKFLNIVRVNEFILTFDWIKVKRHRKTESKTELKKVKGKDKPEEKRRGSALINIDGVKYKGKRIVYNDNSPCKSGESRKYSGECFKISESSSDADIEKLAIQDLSDKEDTSLKIMRQETVRDNHYPEFNKDVLALVHKEK